jgi:hypothetical protein
MTSPPDQTEYLRKYGAIDFAPARKAKPTEPLFTPAEREEMRQFEAAKAEREANAPYLGWAPKPPLHSDPLVCEVAEMLLREFDR